MLKRINHRLICLLVLLAGCGQDRPDRVPVAGQVLIDGEPLTYGVVMFVPPNDRPSSAALDNTGRFQLTCFDEGDGAVLGMHRVAVTAVEPLGPGKQRWHAPRAYVDYHTSGLSAEITGPTDDLVIELSWDGGQPFVENVSGL